MPDAALTPPWLDLTTTLGAAAGSGAPTRVRVRTPATSTKGPLPRSAGSNVTPVEVTYGLRNSCTAGSTDEVVAWMMRRCFWTRYSTEVIVTRSGIGLRVIVAVAGAEVAPVFRAVTARVTVGVPTLTAGAVKDTVA